MSVEGGVLASIREKVEAGHRLSFEDGLALEASNDLFALGTMANLVRERYNGNFGYYNVNTHINPTNVCVYTCDFCAFRADLGEERAYVMDRDQIVERAGRRRRGGRPSCTSSAGCTTSCRSTITWTSSAGSRRRAPRSTSRRTRRSRSSSSARSRGSRSEDVLKELIDAGLGSLPGGGAEIFHPEVREQICGAKASTETWLDVHRTAHRLGLHSNATMLYGHIDRPEAPDRPPRPAPRAPGRDRRLPDVHPAGVPPGQLADGPHPEALGGDGPQGHGDQPADARQLPAHQGLLGHARPQDGPGRPAFGADDIDGTVVHEKIYHEAGAETPQEVTVAEIRRLIAEAGRIPVERDTLYHRVDREGGAWQSGEHIDVPALALQTS